MTADRLADACERWNDYFEGGELDALGAVIHKLECIAEGTAEKIREG